MSLRRFLHESLDDILAEWQKDTGLSAAEQTARRLHFSKVLRAIAEEMGRIPVTAGAAAAVAAAAEESQQRTETSESPHSHAGQLVEDYASLRASVVRQ